MRSSTGTSAAVFRTTLKAGRFVLTAEVKPPVSCDPQDLLKDALPLKDLADAVNVTDGAGAHVHLGALAAAYILAKNGIEPILQVTCRDRNRLALQSDLLAAAALDLQNLLILRGDDPTAGDQPDAKPVFDMDSRSLLEVARRLRDSGTLPTGRPVSGKISFFLGAVDTPIDPPAGWSPHALLGKIAAGAEFVQTQFCMDIPLLRRYLARLAENGVPDRIAILVGMTPLRSARSAIWMRNHLPGTIIPDALIGRLEQASNPGEEGKRICIDLLEELAEIPRIAGAHIMAPGNEHAVPEVIAQFRSMHSRTAGRYEQESI
jgi:methylenetetrahydrofolate reductase (NADPH)